MHAQQQWHRMNIEDCLHILATSVAGLSEIEAKKRLQEYGPNEIIEKPPKPAWLMFLGQFKSVLIGILLVAIIISAALGEVLDACVIVAIVILNAVLGFVQERKAERALAMLKRMAAPMATVIRDGQAKNIPASEIVPGDVLVLKAGDKIPADCRVIEQLNLKTNESMLTGESLPVVKSDRTLSADAPIAERNNMLWSGTTVVYGHCRAVVVETGMHTEFGKIASAVAVPEEPTPLQKQLDRLGWQLGALFLGMCAIIFAIGFVVAGMPLLQIALIAIALAVAAVPEGLPAAITIGLALGVQRMAGRNAIVRRLTAVETLGCTTVICSDKTGTLTMNEMTVRKLWVDKKLIEVTGEGYSKTGKFLLDGKEIDPKDWPDVHLLLLTGMMANDAEWTDDRILGDPTEAALLVSAAKAGIEDLRKKYPRVEELPFDSERKMMSVSCTINNRRVMYTKGAVESVLAACSSIYIDGRAKPMRENDKRLVLEINSQFARSGLRVIAFAVKKLGPKESIAENDLIFIGMQAMADPPRPEVKDAIEECKAAGIRVVMITGDHKDTALAIGRELGVIDSNDQSVLTGVELDALNDEEFQKIVENVKIYARVSPEHKVRICNALRKKGHVVAMTGDGINDAPALKAANIGVAMGVTGTDVSREASDMVLADDNFATIVHAVEEGRGIYDNIRKVLAFLLSGNIAEVLIIFAAIMLGMPLPLVAIQILWINLVTDGLPALALAVDPIDRKEVMTRPPRPKSESIWNGLRLYLIDFPILMLIGTLLLFVWGLQISHVYAMTIAFTSIIIFEKFAAFSCRSLEEPVGRRVLANRYLIYATVLTLALHLAILYVPALNPIFHVEPLGLIDWLAILGAGALVFVYLEAAKAWKSKKKKLGQ